jgi:hypothetical protein
MLAGIMAILSSICSVIAKIIAAIPWQVWAALAIFLFGGWVFYGGSCRDFCCSRTRPPRQEKWDELQVSSVDTGATFKYRDGRRGKRIKTVTLAHIAAPSDIWAESSRVSLEKLAGSTVRIQKHGLFRSTPDDAEDALKGTPKGGDVLEGISEPLESKMMVEIVYNMNGQCLNTEQVRLGMAKLLPDAPEDWKKYEDEAKKNNLGIWKKM